jgi:chemotaxis protein MotB
MAPARACFLMILAGLVAACGIPEGVHNQTVRDLEKCRQDLTNTRADLTRTSLELQDERSRQPGEAPHVEGGPTSKDLAQIARAREAASRRQADEKSLRTQLAQLVESHAVTLSSRHGGLAIDVPEATLFEPGQATLKTEARPTLGRIASALKDIADREILVAGHADAAPPRGGHFRSNWELSAARAVAVVQVLQAEAVDPHRLIAVGRSEFAGEGEPGRVEIRLLPTDAEIFDAQ